MRRSLIAITAAAIVGASCSAALGMTRVAVNPELVNPVVMSSALDSGIVRVVTSPTNPTGVIPGSFWSVPSGNLPVLTTPPAEPPEIVITDVQQRMSILYVTDPAAKAILGSSSRMRELPWLFRQEPSNSAGDAALAGRGTQRMTKVNGAALAAKGSADAMRAMLKSAVDRTCTTPAGATTCAARLVGVDEIGSVFGTAPGASDSGTPGARLKAAMESLSRIEFQPGVSYASRIHFYVAPGVSTSISEGLGPQRTLGRNGEEMRRDYSQVMSAMARSGGAWLEMYHYPGRGKPRTPFTAAEWRDVPTRFAAFLRERSATGRNPLNYLHFVLTETSGSDQPLGDPCRTTPDGSSPNARESSASFMSTITLLPFCPENTPRTCQVLAPTGGATSHALAPIRRSMRRPDIIIERTIRNLASNAIIDTVVNGPLTLVTNAPTPSGMTCQWQRAQAGDVNTRILANGPAAFKVTGTEAEIFGQQFRQFFIVG